MKVKGFTLIECLIAMFILGISSLLLAQGYTQLMNVTNRSTRITSSIGQQMKDAEAGTDDTTYSKKLREDEMKIKLCEVSGSDTVESRSYDAKGEYVTSMSVWEVKAYKYNGNNYEDESIDGSEMRYVYFHK